MSLENLVGISIEKIAVDNQHIERLLESAMRSIKDANVKVLSAETRFDAAYKAIMQIANAALCVNGYRTLTSKPGHHQTMINALSKTLNVDRATLIVLDALRKQRNIIDYTGDLVSESMVNDCIQEAEKLICVFREQNSPD